MSSSIESCANRLPRLRSACWRRIAGWVANLGVRRAPKQLHVAETVNLGEKRIVAVVEYEGQKFLVGGGAQSVNLLARLGATESFSELMTDWCERQR